MNDFKKILIVRTDRIGDVLLSTPAIKAVRKQYPLSQISMMVRPYARDIILGNPYLDEVMIYDKYGRQRRFWSNIRFAWRLRKKKFDLAIVLHPTNRAHLLIFLAGIKKRVGFNRKMGFLLTDKIVHTKQYGQRHELEYTLDLLNNLGILSEEKDLFMPIRKDSELYIEEFLAACGWQKGERLVALHPGASCLSKVWPTERFTQVAQRLAEEFKVRAVVVCDRVNLDIGNRLVNMLKNGCIDACAKTSISQLASLLRRCALFISNDSGPVHLAAALGISTVVIFGRNQPGLSPRRWGPVGNAQVVLHKDVGCEVCFAHNCQKGFSCLKAISADEVFNAAKKLLTIFR